MSTPLSYHSLRTKTVHWPLEVKMLFRNKNMHMITHKVFRSVPPCFKFSCLVLRYKRELENFVWLHDIFKTLIRFIAKEG